MMFHPREATLLRYAAGSAVERDRRQVASHLADCNRCRTEVQSTRELRSVLANGGALPAPDALLTRILSSRAAGERMILPVEPPRTRERFQTPKFSMRIEAPKPIYWVLLGSVAAIAAVTIIPTINLDPAQIRAMLPIPRATSRGIQGQPAWADGPTANVGPFNPARLRPMTLRYGVASMSGTRFDESAPAVTYRFVRPRNAENTWLLIREVEQFDRRAPDSMWINATTLEPTEWHSPGFFRGENSRSIFHLSDGLLRVQNRYRASPTAAVRRVLGAPDTTYAVPASSRLLYQGEASLIAWMMAAPLSIGWRGAFGQIDIREKRVRIVSGSIFEITGSHRVVTPAGIFDCWEATAPTYPGRAAWYRKSDGVFIGSASTSGLGHTKFETLLLSEE